jgi:hypothetical protein
MLPSRPLASIAVPSAGRLRGFVNLEPSSFDCSAITNLQTQVAPLIALMSCQVKILDLLRPLIEVVKGLPNPSTNAISEFLETATALAPCLASTSPSGLLPFLQDLLCVQIRSLNCLSRKLKDLLALTVGNPAAVPASQWQGLLDAYVSIVGIFDMAGDLFQMAGIIPPELPVLDVQSDLSISQSQNTIAQVTEALQLVVDALGGCS